MVTTPSVIVAGYGNRSLENALGVHRAFFRDIRGFSEIDGETRS